MKKRTINKNKIGTNILMMSLIISGMISLTSGAVLNKMEFKKPKNKVKIKIVEKSLGKQKTNVPKLKEIEVEVNVPISVNIEDYIENLNEIDEKVLKKFKLDTSLVNVSEKGTYTYTISYKDKKYNGTVNVKEKELPTIEKMTLKEINIEKGSNLPQNLNDYIVEDIPEEAKAVIKIDTSKVNTNNAGTYQYTVKYKDKIYTGTIKVFEPQVTPPKKEEIKPETPPTEVEIPNTPDDKQEENKTEENTNKKN